VKLFLPPGFDGLDWMWSEHRHTSPISMLLDLQFCISVNRSKNHWPERIAVGKAWSIADSQQCVV